MGIAAWMIFLIRLEEGHDLTLSLLRKRNIQRMNRCCPSPLPKVSHFHRIITGQEAVMKIVKSITPMLEPIRLLIIRRAKEEHQALTLHWNVGNRQTCAEIRPKVQLCTNRNLQDLNQVWSSNRINALWAKIPNL